MLKKKQKLLQKGKFLKVKKTSQKREQLSQKNILTLLGMSQFLLVLLTIPPKIKSLTRAWI
jgi:hypothetical protein